MKNLVFIGFALLICFQTYAQSFVDNALLFSRTTPGGSARIQAIGGAQVSLGGDYSSAFSNPAGLGMYNRSEFTFTPGYSLSNIQSTYAGISASDNKTKLNIPGISYVYHHETGKQSGFLGGSLGISLTRVNDFNQTYNYSGMNSESSIVDYFLDDAYNYDPGEMLRGGQDFYNLTALAYNNYLFEDYYDNNNNLFYGSVLSPLPADPPNGIPAEVRTVRQAETVESTGAQNQWSISYGANFSDKFFIGAGVGIATLRYKLKLQYSESDFSYSEDPNYNPIDYFQTEENLEIRGSGVNFTLGMIYRPIDFLQVGASVVTPTFYQVTDTYNARLSSQWNAFDYYGDQSTILNFVEEEFDTPLISEYNFTTPLKFSTGATLISKIGFISADVEMVNYGKTKYSSNTGGVSFSGDNDAIKSLYESVINYRVGAEYRYGIWRLRGGYRFMADPYRSSEIDRSSQTITGGLGIRKEKFFIDFAVVHTTADDQRIPYRAPGFPIPVAKLENKFTSYMFTIGFPF
ncbi:MAG TPA: hypothetical protein VFW11_17200 [Cyclobacteriaceae bacterium]|nr:hypothetical protein [Cyclobacteriaceae bacterium]